MNIVLLIIAALTLLLLSPFAMAAPAVPCAPTMTAGTGTSISIAWVAVPGATSYKVERCVVNVTSTCSATADQCVTWAQAGSPTTPSFDDTAVPAASYVEYRVSAVDGTGTSEPSLVSTFRIP